MIRSWGVEGDFAPTTHPKVPFSPMATYWGQSSARSRRISRLTPNDRNVPPPGPGARSGPRINEQIRLTPIRVIGANGEQLGIIPTSQAMEMARELNLDLVEVAATERPPVCKIMDYGKFRYQQSRKSGKTKSHQQKTKEIRVRPKTGEHDVETKLAQARKFLEASDKVLLKVQFRGREIQHIEEGQRIIQAMIEKLLEVGKLERPPSLEGKQMSAILAPKSSKS
ncbi:translation initiation factor IF-3 [Tuwongella immobilis]|uniref:Translation initiation factor IF-3 n=1 Tax=Tuwongella immobilis TaxID=692036 RepID=A0A6C2YVX0_9BACT|nr:translation initiation factor IF-3 [Tuwongella immobilis]VIP05517.1 translation initiation factor if-3 : Translation initiation factor IF-3 OS=Isosphaera pallida (strain ATCC 43644 / DSM 9630 / IS1B) GN=infC PE=3 SV=1: IF3_N: IF3_C [Tuwongella immobilis]VTS08390.1 translation initiation factor if-3 : Translation initiation factor IF-3 OS=Isosphaera pallida (strain ATCC 43644 / DSM 9630 / IS1B) GN=infC PE=3 SV=1: IF3_N: IF3_C [Tuwongella immobilis]